MSGPEAAALSGPEAAALSGPETVAVSGPEAAAVSGPEAAAVSAGEQGADEALKAIAEPRRRAILLLVAHDDLAAGEIAAAFDVTRTAISQHLTVLKSAGLLTERREGTRRLYRARPEGLEGLREFLNDVWAASLDTARQIVEADRGLSDAGRSAQAG